MKKTMIDSIVSKPVGWLEDSAPSGDIAISTRIRLARNLFGVPFPVQAGGATLAAVSSEIKSAIKKTKFLKGAFDVDMDGISKVDAGVLIERHLISYELAERTEGAALVSDKDENLSVMINEEDHLRIQALCPGLCLLDAWRKIDRFDDAICRELEIAFDDTLGFLTSCPTNLGTGMRASVMLHLPALALAEQVDKLVRGVNKLGLAVRGIFGEGTENLGNLCQISNQSTLGESEKDILKRLDAVIAHVVTHEKNARAKLLETRNNFLLDSVGRAYGTLKYAYSISLREALASLSLLRLGVDMGLISKVSVKTINELFMLVQAAHIHKLRPNVVSDEERHAVRASIIREKLNQSS